MAWSANRGYGIVRNRRHPTSVPATSLESQSCSNTCSGQMAHTTVSVTKGIGRAEVGGLAGLSLCVGGYGNMLERLRVCLMPLCRSTCLPVARRLDRAKHSIALI
jgi:hypothetical protein